jgi:hypothetical protein
VQDLFVTDKDSFEVSVNYLREGGKLVVRRADTLDEAEKASGKFKAISIKFVVPTWTKAQEIMRASTPYVNGRPQIDFGVFQIALMRALACGWDLKDEKGEETVFSLEQLGNIRPEIGRAIFEGLQEKLNEIGVYDSILAS